MVILIIAFKAKTLGRESPIKGDFRSFFGKIRRIQMAAQVIDNIIKAEQQADEKKQSGFRLAEEQIAKAQEDVQKYIHEDIQLAKKQAQEFIESANADGENAYKHILAEYDTRIAEELNIVEDNKKLAVSQVIAAIIN